MNQIQYILNKIRRYLTKIDMKVYFVCVLIATFIWLMMKLSDGYSKEIEVPLKYVNAPKGMILVNEPVSTLKVHVESKGFQMVTIALRNNKQVKVDLKNLSLRRTKYKRWVASIAAKSFGAEITNQLGVELASSDVQPDSVFFVFDSLITKEIPVKIESRVSYVEGNTLYGDLKVSPSKILVTGPALSLRSIKAITADSLVMEHVSEDFSQNLKLQSPGEFIELNPRNVEVSAKVTKFSEFSKEIPLTINTNVPNLKIRLFPAKVKITYSIPIPEFDNITDSSFQVMVVIDSLDILKKSILIPKISKQPNFVRSSYLDVDKVEFIILK